MEKISVQCKLADGQLYRNHKRYDLPKEVVADFLGRPASERVVTLGFPKSTDIFTPDSLEELTRKAGVGTLDQLIEKGGESLAVMTIDPTLPCSKTLAVMLESGTRMSLTLCGYGDASPDDPSQIQYTDITHAVILPESMEAQDA